MSTNSSQPNTRFNRCDALILALVAVLAVISALAFYVPTLGRSGELTVVISVGGQEQERIPLTQLPDAPMRIDGQDGYTLWLSLAGDDLLGSDGSGVYVRESTCPTQDCVHTGCITRAGQSIVCLPAQLVIHLEGAASGTAPDVMVG